MLKGPQGTLFGRNATAGAILVYSAPPVHELEGYAAIRIGDYDSREFEAAINLPIVRDKVALRLAGQRASRDGYTRNLGAGPDLDDRDDSSLRASLLIEPVERVENLTTIDRYRAREAGGSALLYGLYPNATAGPGAARGPALAPGFDCGRSVDCDVDLQLARQREIGPRRTYVDVPAFSDITLNGLSNTTTIGDENLRIKNIFGYRDVRLDFRNDIDGTPLRLVDTTQRFRTRQITNELQASGKVLDGTIDWIAGGFYLDDRPDGTNTVAAVILNPTGIASNAQTYRYIESKAVYGQLGLDLDRLVRGIKVDIGARHTWDKSVSCSIVTRAGDPLRTADQCSRGGQTLRGEFDATTWTVGVNWQASPDTFLYATSRRGYRAGGLNAPFLSTRLSPVQTYRPETITDVELGVKTSGRLFDRRYRINVSGYRGWYSGVQRNYAPPPNFDGDDNPANDPASGVVVNAGKAILQGVEFEATLALAEGLDVSASGAYTEAHYRSLTLPPVLAAANLIPPNAVDNKFPFVPAWTFGANIGYRRPLGEIGSLIASADVYGSTRFWLNDRPAADIAARAEGYALANARVGLGDIGGSGIDASVFGNNIFNKAYVAGTGNFAPGLSFVSVSYGAPRIYGLELRHRF